MGIFSSIVKGVGSALGAVKNSAEKAFSSTPLGAGVIGLLDSFSQDSSAKESAEQQYNYQKSLIDYQNQFNASEAEKARNFNAEQAKLAQEYNSAEAEKNRKFQRDSAIEMFNLENEYNDPSAQIARMKKAGINPASFSGGSLVPASGSAPSGSSASGSGASGSPASSGSGGIPSIPNPKTLNQMRLEEAQARIAQANADSAETDASRNRKRFESENKPYSNVDNVVLRFEDGTLEPLVYENTTQYDEERQEKRLGLNQLKLNIENTELNNKLLKDTLPILSKMPRWQLNELKKRVALLESESSNLDMQTAVTSLEKWFKEKDKQFFEQFDSPTQQMLLKTILEHPTVITDFIDAITSVIPVGKFATLLKAFNKVKKP